MKKKLWSKKKKVINLKARFEEIKQSIQSIEVVISEQIMGKMELKSDDDESNVSQEDSTDGRQFKGLVTSKLRYTNGRYVSSRKDEKNINENKDNVIELGRKSEMVYEKWESAREKYSKSLKEYRSIKSQIELC